MANFVIVLPRLVATYEAGRLVPFIGSGMSRRTCTDWVTFVRKLEAAAARVESLPPDDRPPLREDLIRRANSAVRALKAREPGAFARAVRKALFSDDAGAAPIPSQTDALARLWWPLVVSTNYDNCYAAAFRRNFQERQLATSDAAAKTASAC